MKKQFPIYTWTQGTNYKTIFEFNHFGYLIQVFTRTDRQVRPRRWWEVWRK